MMKKILNKIQYLFFLGVIYAPILIKAETPGTPPTPPTPITLGNPLKVDTFEALIAEILKVVVMIASPIAVLAIIYSGFLFVKARGKPEELKSARETLMWTIIGIAVLLGASVLSAVIKGTIQSLK
ncbi:MAG: hypothetical protein KAR54_00650 [Candidatus Pacebacteria bacterium]|nr:hypothetical protein [Candidatus Paceibacterota bacterium]